jgi:hypothetical protein
VPKPGRRLFAALSTARMVSVTCRCARGALR